MSADPPHGCLIEPFDDDHCLSQSAGMVSRDAEAYHREMEVVRITLAVDDLNGMVAFYNECFRCGLEPVEGSPLFIGSFAGIEFQLCPNSLAGVVADQNRHQFRLAADDPEDLAASVVSAGGAITNRSENDGRVVLGIADPEGNTMELVSA